MSNDPQAPSQARPRSGIQWIALEALVIVVLGAALAFAANALSPRGLTLAHNYFPGATNGIVSAPADSQVAALEQKGLKGVDGLAVLRLSQDPRLQQGLLVFIDARNEEHYLQGHIPGAYELDPYYPQLQLARVLPICQAAEEVVVYCNGGDCEDSEFAAIALRDVGIQNEKLRIYTGGMSEWTKNGWPLEKGERNAGNAPEAKP